jgi:hypothetical protein
VFGPEYIISANRSCEASILLHWSQNNIWSVSVYFTNLRHGIRCKTCVSGLNALFPETKVVKHPFYSIGPKMMFRSGSVPFANLQHVKAPKLVFDPECTISWYRNCDTSIPVHWTQNDVWESFRAFH